MRKAFLTAIAVCYFFELFSQDTPVYQKMLSLGLGGGYNFPVKRYMTQDPMDGQLGYRDRYGAINPSIYLFPAKRWGLVIAFNIDPVSATDRQKNELNRSLEAYYSGFEFRHPAYGDNWDFIYDPTSFRLVAGPVYRFEKKRWFFWSSLGIGITGFTVADLNAEALKKQSNEYYLVSRKGKRTPAPFTISPGVLAGYRISRHTAVALSARAAYFKTDFSQTLVRTSRYTGAEEEDVQFRFNRSSLILGADATFFISILFPKK